MTDSGTEKLYYANQHANACEARVVDINRFGIALDRTVAFPEGGGQESDHGTIVFDSGEFRFGGVRKLFGMPVNLPDFPDITVGGRIFHVPIEGQEGVVGQLESGMEVLVKIDVERRERLTVSHTATHLLYLGIEQVRPDLLARITGCKITEMSGGFSFSTDQRITGGEVAAINDFANELVERDLPIEILTPYVDTLDARVWRCGNFSIPCGGTHLQNTAPVGPILTSRRSAGRSQERAKCSFPQAQVDLGKYS